MNPKLSISDINRRLENLIRIGVITDVDLEKSLCRVQTGNNKTDWRPWMTTRAGQSRTWWAPSIDEQVLILSIGGNLETSFILPAIYSNQFNEPSSSENANVTEYPDGARFEYEPKNSSLKITGIKTLVIEASEEITINCPQITIPKGNVTHNGGNLSSHGKVLHTHKHSGILPGGSNTGTPV